MNLYKKWLILAWICGLAGVLLTSVVISVSIGSARLPVDVVWRILLLKAGLYPDTLADWPASAETIVWQVRLPRILLAMLVGAALAVAGVGFQAVLRNPLADPYILGVSSGAALGAAVVIVFGWQSLLGEWTIPAVAFSLGLLTLFLVYRLAMVERGVAMETLLLSGVVVQAFLGALLSFFLSISDDRMQQIIYWLMGSFALKDWVSSWVVLPFLMFGWLLLFALSNSLNILSLGEAQAAHLGVSVDRVRLLVLTASTLMTAAAVSVSGTIGFVGLVIPHMMRLLVGADHRILIPVSTLAGSILMVWADTAARMVFSPRELPVGVITALLGAPFFAYLLRRVRRQRG
ncbi:MAG: iron ABC transporter [Bacillus thermozeamaize]|uniref:Iron ABC transporter n=1 Tax=Bacillus thermozeamaize TaxID=230954 RepID=A0A1Y3PF46_9BACI|nr:MAG: iron ABC transporter [Bacillus thermozeamaize]